MDGRSVIREFLSGRRARLTPEQVGLPVPGHAAGRRRVAGLRREEVALLAGVSVEYYTRIERGNLKGVSDAVLESLARALQLDDAERGHLVDLARAANTSASATARRRPPRPVHVRSGLVQLVEAMADVPAWVRNGCGDILAINALGRALYSPLFDPLPGSEAGRDGERRPNTARFTYLDPRAQEFYVEWPAVARDMVGMLRLAAGRDPHDRGLAELIGELSTRSEVFASNWARHDVFAHSHGGKRLRHPVVGELDLNYEALALPSDPGLTLLVYTAPPGSPAQDGLRLLASWGATREGERRPSPGPGPEVRGR